MRFITHKIILAIVLAAIAVTVWASFQIIYPYNPLNFHDEFFPIKRSELHQGENLEFLVRYCKNMQKPAIVHYQFENSVIFFSTTVNHANVAKGCGEHWNLFKIPEELPEGTYRLVMTVDYQVSPIRVVSVRGATEEFNIIK